MVGFGQLFGVAYGGIGELGKKAGWRFQFCLVFTAKLGEGCPC